jgi:D-methionine transport system substrate-binding protein
MKKFISLALIAAMGLFTFAGCGSQNTNASADNSGEEMVTLTVGASTTPHAEILNALKDTLASEGVDLVVKEYSDYVIPNTAVESGEIDANYFQHITYMNDFNAENGTHLVSAAEVHYEPMGIYAGKSSDLSNIPDGATIAVPNDNTNEARALQLLASEGIITLPADADQNVTKKDIVDNPHNIDIVELEAAAVPRALEDSDFAVINGNYALSAGLTDEDGLAFEGDDSLGATMYVNVLAVKEGNENNEAVQKLVAALHSDECRKFIEETYNGMVVPVF